MADIYTARTGFACAAPTGEQVIVYTGDTVEAGHWLLDANPAAFNLIEAKYPAPVKEKPVVVKMPAPKV